MDKRTILKTIRTYEELDVDQLIRYDLGLEIQDFTSPNLKDYEMDYIVEFYKEKLDGFKGVKAMHGPFIDLKPVSPDNLIRRISCLKYERTMDVAVELDIDYVIFHSQINPNHIGEDVEEINLRESAIFWNKFMDKYKEFKGTIVIENVFEKEASMIRSLLDRIDRENIKINLDLGHARLSNQPIKDWIIELKDYISYIHVHTNDRIYDRHQAPSRIEVEKLYNLLDKYNINPILSLEYKIHNMAEEIRKYR